jgi:hypothetical protein
MTPNYTKIIIINQQLAMKTTNIVEIPSHTKQSLAKLVCLFGGGVAMPGRLKCWTQASHLKHTWWIQQLQAPYF